LVLVAPYSLQIVKSIGVFRPQMAKPLAFAALLCT